MPNLPFLFAPLALLLPLGMLDAPQGESVAEPQIAHQTEDGDRQQARLPLSRKVPAWSPVLEGIRPPTSGQVRIDRRVILRISPAPGPARQRLNAETPREPARTRVVERPAAKCVDSSSIGGVADRGDRLLMFLRDRRVLSARLEKGCSPRDFYRGFYMERSEDGKLCVKRDRLMSRSGAKCQVDSFKELVVEPVD